MTPLERAGKALYERDPLTQDVFRRDCLNPAAGFASRTEPLPWEELGQDDRDAYIADARAVIEAIREPSEAMEAAGYGNTKGDPDNTGIVDNPRPDDAWRAMIDALLEEGR